MLDLPRIETLRHELGEVVFSEVASDFLMEVDGVMANIGHAGSAASLIEDLHFVRGSAMALGFTALALLCEVVERQAGENSLSVDLAPLKLVYKMSVRQFGTLLKRHEVAAGPVEALAI